MSISPGIPGVGIKNRKRSGQEGVPIFNGHVIENGVYVREKTPMPMHIIFDEEARVKRPDVWRSFCNTNRRI